MKNIITLRDYIQQAEKSHSLERKQIIDLLDSNNPEILHQLCLAAGRCRRRWLFHETQLVCFFDFGEEAPDADGTERLILKAENAGFRRHYGNTLPTNAGSAECSSFSALTNSI